MTRWIMGSTAFAHVKSSVWTEFISFAQVGLSELQDKTQSRTEKTSAAFGAGNCGSQFERQKKMFLDPSVLTKTSRPLPAADAMSDEGHVLSPDCEWQKTLDISVLNDNFCHGSLASCPWSTFQLFSCLFHQENFCKNRPSVFVFRINVLQRWNIRCITYLHVCFTWCYVDYLWDLFMKWSWPRSRRVNHSRVTQHVPFTSLMSGTFWAPTNGNRVPWWCFAMVVNVMLNAVQWKAKTWCDVTLIPTFAMEVKNETWKACWYHWDVSQFWSVCDISGKFRISHHDLSVILIKLDFCWAASVNFLLVTLHKREEMLFSEKEQSYLIKALSSRPICLEFIGLLRTLWTWESTLKNKEMLRCSGWWFQCQQVWFQW